MLTFAFQWVELIRILDQVQTLIKIPSLEGNTFKFENWEQVVPYRVKGFRDTLKAN
jgi:hypothetical protein